MALPQKKACLQVPAVGVASGRQLVCEQADHPDHKQKGTRKFLDHNQTPSDLSTWPITSAVEFANKVTSVTRTVMFTNKDKSLPSAACQASCPTSQVRKEFRMAAPAAMLRDSGQSQDLRGK